MPAPTNDHTHKAVAAFACMLLSACGGGNDIAGTYTCENLGFVKSIELTPKGKIYAKAEVLGETQQTAGTYEIDGNRLIGTVNGETTVMDIDDGILVSGQGKCVPGDYTEPQNSSITRPPKEAVETKASGDRELIGTYRIDMAALMKTPLAPTKNIEEARTEIGKLKVTIKPDKRIAIDFPDHQQETTYKREGSTLIVSDEKRRYPQSDFEPTHFEISDDGSLLLYPEGEEFPITFVRR